MKRTYIFSWLVAAYVIPLCAAHAEPGSLPPDVRQGHWAATAVARSLRAGLLRTQSDGKFHGDAKVTRTEAVVALAKLGRALVEHQWKAEGTGRPVPDSVAGLWDKTNWKVEPVRRYALSVILTRFGDYVAAALPNPPAGANVGKSVALPDVIVTVSSNNPAYASLTYLAHNHMIAPGSALLKPDSSSLLGGELSRGLADLASGVNDRLTDLGKGADGSTQDGTPQKPAPH